MSQPELIPAPEPRDPHRTHAIMVSSETGTIHWAGQEFDIERVGYIYFDKDGAIKAIATQFTEDENETGWDICATCNHLEQSHRITAPQLGPCTFKDCHCKKFTEEP